MSNIAKRWFVFSCIASVFIMFKKVHGADTITTSTTATTTFNIPYRYNRYIFFYLSENATTEYLTKVLHKLFELDNYCGGENIVSTVYFGNRIASKENDCAAPWGCSLQDTFSNYDRDIYSLSLLMDYCKAKNVAAGSIDKKDERNFTQSFLNQLHNIFEISYVSQQLPSPINVMSQVILITDYANEHLGNSNETDILKHFQSQNNIVFIALTTNLSNATASSSFWDEVWQVHTTYMNWTLNSGINPICGFESESYTTRNPAYFGGGHLTVSLLFSSDYIKKRADQVISVASLLSQLTARRYVNPCNQYRSIIFNVKYPTKDLNNEGGYCFADPGFEDITTCSTERFRQMFGPNASFVLTAEESQNPACSKAFRDFFTFFHPVEINSTLINNKKCLLITDLSLQCLDEANGVFAFLEKYRFFETGAPFTIIAIDKQGESTVAESYEQLFPRGQLPNLFRVNDIDELLLNINTSINFCLSCQQEILGLTPEPPRVVWYFYVISAAFILVLISFSAIIFLTRRRRKRDRILRELANRLNLAPNATSSDNQYERPLHTSMTAMKDIWEVPFQSVNIDFKTVIGKGAFSVVHLGFLNGKAPVVNIFPSIAMQKFANCSVAIKTLPQHCNDSDKENFTREIELMKEIGFHVHLVSMLGYNCSVERPFLLMELANQDLLHWLLAQNGFAIEQETNIFKIMLSICWQISDGMSYLSSKYFIHRDLAARNVLLNIEMKAMVSDFGLCKKLDDKEQVLVQVGGKLPLKWMALESLQENKFSLKTDVWSFGVLLFEIFSLGQEPYKEIPNNELTSFIESEMRLCKPELASDDIYDLMRQCWRENPAERPNFFEIQTVFMAMLENSTVSYGYLPTTETQEGRITE